jgi:hypothetical protein
MTVWLTACDHLLLNEIESCAFSRQPDVETASRWLSRKAKPGAAIVIKQGPGCDRLAQRREIPCPGA